MLIKLELKVSLYLKYDSVVCFIPMSPRDGVPVTFEI